MKDKVIDLSTIDKNFKVETTITEPDIVWFDVKNAPFAIHGVTYDSNQGLFIRMPQEIANKTNDGVAYLCKNTSGGRVRFRTNSKFLGIKVVYKAEPPYGHFSITGHRGFDIYKDIKNESVYCGSFIPPRPSPDGYSSSCELDGQMHDYTINFPLYNPVNELYIALKKDALLSEPSPYKDIAPILYYGSSITQGGCASKPGNSYQYMICRKTNVDFVNLGFSGSARAEDIMINYLCSLNPSIFVYDYDHNAPSAEHLEKTHMKLFRAFRHAHPTTPVIFMTAPGNLFTRRKDYYPRHDVIYNNYLTAKNEGDKNVYFVDGYTIFEGEFFSECTVDGVHPNDLGFSYMAKALLPIIKDILKI
ncbi:MAG: hypothetical protein E7353_04070 [Clostridiales bacterium]|nr:hypothetical protein [Clostridiales bacterium]